MKLCESKLSEESAWNRYHDLLNPSNINKVSAIKLVLLSKSIWSDTGLAHVVKLQLCKWVVVLPGWKLLWVQGTDLGPKADTVWGHCTDSSPAMTARVPIYGSAAYDNRPCLRAVNLPPHWFFIPYSRLRHEITNSMRNCHFQGIELLVNLISFC